MAAPCAVLIATTNVRSAFKQRAALPARPVEILIDGSPATLLDLSTCGAQVISPTILRPHQRVRVALTEDAGIIRFNAAIAWAAFEIPPGISPQYRAGIEFVDADAAAIDAFCVRHRV